MDEILVSLIAEPYLNEGNPLVLTMAPKSAHRILDIGCGGGDNARLLRQENPHVEIVGLTHSAEEATIAAAHLDAVHVIDLEQGLTDSALSDWGEDFDLLLFSHILEHLTDPVATLRRCLTRLAPGGHVLIAVPNVLEWRTRMSFLRGHFDYADHGILDRTHVKFFTYMSAPKELIAPIDGLELVEQRGRGSAPLGPLRRLNAIRSVCAKIDQAGLERWPNICASETVMLCGWKG